MAPPAPKQPKVFCQFPVQLVIQAVLLVIAAAMPVSHVPHPLSLLLVLAAVILPGYCFAKAEPPEGEGT